MTLPPIRQSGRGILCDSCGIGLGAAMLAVLAACSTPAQDRPQRLIAESTWPSAAELLQATASALGSDRARTAALGLRVEQAGTLFPVEQARSPAEPIGRAERVYAWWFDLPRGNLIREADQTFPGGIRFSNRAVVTPEGGWSVDLLRWRTGIDLARFGAEEALRNRLQFERFLPHLMIAQAQAATQVEPTGTGGFRYLDAAGSWIAVTLDPATLRPISAVQSADGGAQIELLYSDYVARHGVMMPARLKILQTGRLQEEVTLGRTRLARIEAAQLSPPTGYAPPPNGEPGARALAPGILLFENMPGGYHSLAIDMGDHLILAEAPLNPAFADSQKRILDELHPGKPIRYVLVTHHHGDHTGGLGRWSEAGARIVVPRGAKVAIERQLKARGSSGAETIEEVSGSRSFAAGAVRVDVHAFEGAHAEANMIVHIPGPNILFQGDLFYLPERGDVPPAFDVVRDLQRQIDALGLAVELVVGVHGRPATIEQVRESLRRRARQ